MDAARGASALAAQQPGVPFTGGASLGQRALPLPSSHSPSRLHHPPTYSMHLPQHSPPFNSSLSPVRIAHRSQIHSARFGIRSHTFSSFILHSTNRIHPSPSSAFERVSLAVCLPCASSSLSPCALVHGAFRAAALVGGFETRRSFAFVGAGCRRHMPAETSRREVRTDNRCGRVCRGGALEDDAPRGGRATTTRPEEGEASRKERGDSPH